MVSFDSRRLETNFSFFRRGIKTHPDPETEEKVAADHLPDGERELLHAGVHRDIEPSRVHGGAARDQSGVGISEQGNGPGVADATLVVCLRRDVVHLTHRVGEVDAMLVVQALAVHGLRLHDGIEAPAHETSGGSC